MDLVNAYNGDAAASEAAFIDGTHPALAGNSLALDSLRSSSPTRSASPTSSASSSPRFSAIDDSPVQDGKIPPIRSGGAGLTNGTNSGATNTGPKGVLADFQAQQSSIGQTTQTGPKGVLSDYRGSQQAAAEYAMANLKLDPPSKMVLSLNDEEMDAKEEYRKRRLAELNGSGHAERGARTRKVFGHLREIDVDQFLSAVEEEDAEVAVVLHIYEPDIEPCMILNQHLSAIARSFPRTKFIRALASEIDFAAESEDATLPTVLVYRAGELETTFVRIDLDWGKGTKAEVVDLLIGCDAIAGSAVTPLQTNGIRASTNVDSDDE